MCRKFLLDLVSLNIFNFLNKITIKQQYLYIVIVFIFAMIALRFFANLYHMEGLSKLFIFLALILFLIGGILNSLKIIINNQGDFQNKYIAIYYCIQLIVIMIILIYFIFKFLNLIFFLMFS